jgi:hypothetical protein
MKPLPKKWFLFIISEALVYSTLLLQKGFNSQFKIKLKLKILFVISERLSALRLDKKLSIFTGAIAGIEYCLLSLYALKITTNTSGLDRVFLEPPIYVAKSIMLLISHEVYSALENKIGESCGEVSVKGRLEPVKIYKLA